MNKICFTTTTKTGQMYMIMLSAGLTNVDIIFGKRSKGRKGGKSYKDLYYLIVSKKTFISACKKGKVRFELLF